MDSNENQLEMEPSAGNERPQAEKPLRTETFYGVRYTKEEIKSIRRSIYDSKLMATEWIRRKILTEP